MHFSPGGDHSEHDRRETSLSPAGCRRSRLRLYRHFADMVHRGRDHEPTNGKCTGSGFASGHRSSRRHCFARDHELVLSQDLLGRLDPRSQSKTKITDR